MAEILIPKTFHRIWFGKKTMPDIFVEYGKTWLDKHPDWKMVLWTDDNIHDITLQNQDLFNSTDHPVLRTGIIRS